MSELTPEQKQQVLFMQLVLTFQQAAWQQMGKIPNPATNQVERNLEQARYSIDMLDMLQGRTQGNLNTEETNFLAHILRELKLNYIDEKDRPEASPEAPASPEAEEPSTPA